MLCAAQHQVNGQQWDVCNHWCYNTKDCSEQCAEEEREHKPTCMPFRSSLYECCCFLKVCMTMSSSAVKAQKMLASDMSLHSVYCRHHSRPTCTLYLWCSQYRSADLGYLAHAVDSLVKRIGLDNRLMGSTQTGKTVPLF